VARVLSSVFRRRFDERLRRGPGIGTAAAFEAADGSHRHIVIAQDLARQAYAGQTAGGEDGALRDGAPFRLALDELHAAGRATGSAATGVQLIDPGVLLEREDEALPFRHVKSADVLHGQLRHLKNNSKRFGPRSSVHGPQSSGPQSMVLSPLVLGPLVLGPLVLGPLVLGPPAAARCFVCQGLAAECRDSTIARAA